MTDIGRKLQRMIDQNRNLPETDSERKLATELGELAGRIERGEEPRPPRWKPSFPDLFGGNWEVLDRLH